jgi:hypothetical protein
VLETHSSTPTWSPSPSPEPLTIWESSVTVVNSIYEVAPPKMPAPSHSYHPQQSFPSHLPPQGLYRDYILNFYNVNFGILLLFSDVFLFFSSKT